MEMREELKKRTGEVEAVVESYLPKEEGHQKTIFEAMNYSVRAGGKSCKGIPFYRENFRICSNKNYIIKCRIKVKLDIKTIMLYTKIVLKSN